MMGLSWHEFLIVGVIAILLFGKRLPEVARSLGGSYREFKRGLSEFHSQLEAPDHHTTASRPAASAPRDYDDYEEASAPRFEPPPAEPTSSSSGSTTANS